ncbi:MAG: serine hydrolase, partial [Sphingomicrobium sp.]
MTSRRRHLGKALGALAIIAVSAQVSASAPAESKVQPTPGSPRQPTVSAVRHAPVAPANLRNRINELGRNFNGQVGIAVRSIDDGWSIGWKADEYYPQQSVSKLWVSITALDAVDRGR